MTGAGLYLHIPFCRSKCGYCAFNSVAGQRDTVDSYLELLASQIREYGDLAWSRSQRFTTVFIGGGTPSLASPTKLAATLALCRHVFDIDDQAEITLEANPDSLDLELLTTLRDAGVNRLSIGVQSFADELLTSLGRAHTGRQATRAFALARQSGVTNINLDLIYGLPGQSLALWQADLRQALDLAPDHLALYELSIEPDTPFARRQKANRLHLPDEDLVADMEEATLGLLAPHYRRYEISNYARPGRECLHNLDYWHNGSYLGLGAGAVSCLDGVRLSHETDPDRFMTALSQGLPTIRQAECLSPHGRFRESMIMGLRLIQGLDLAGLEQRLQVSAAEVYGTLLADLLDRSMLIRQGNMVRLAPRYLPVANQILTKLV